jgi:hypothetical protein
MPKVSAAEVKIIGRRISGLPSGKGLSLARRELGVNVRRDCAAQLGLQCDHTRPAFTIEGVSPELRLAFGFDQPRDQAYR